MTSIITNWQATSALASLRMADTDLNRTQTMMSSGLRINRASDDAAYWSIATTMRSDNKALSSVKDSLNLALSIVDTAFAAQGTVLDNLSALMSDLVVGRSNQSDTTLLHKLENDMLARIKAISATITAASFNGVNLLYHQTGQPTTFSYVSSASRGSDGTFAVQTVDVDLSSISLIDDVATAGVLSKSYTDRFAATSGRVLFRDFGPTQWQPTLFQSWGGFAQQPKATVTAHIDIMDQLNKAAITSFAQLGAIRASLASQLDHVNRQAETGTKGIGRLVDADMNEESARLKADQVRQQLSIQTLSIANDRPKTLLQLFAN